jgi:hypothetical protein
MIRYLLLSLLVLPAIARAEDLSTMVNYVPREANALLVVDFKNLMASPMAEKEGWKKRVAEGTMVGLLPYPETAEYALVAEQLLPGTLQSKWELVLISTSKPYSLPDIAKSEKAEIESIGTTPACFTKRNTVILQLSPTLMGVYSPAHRQDVSRWLRANTGKTLVNTRLAKAPDLIKNGNHVALLFDVEDTLEASKVSKFVASEKVVKDNKLDVTQLSKVFASLSMVTFTIKVDQASKSVMKMDFTEKVSGFAAVLPSLVISAFEMLGPDLSDYRKGTSTATDTTVSVDTMLTPIGFRSTIGMIQPHSVASANKPGDSEDPVKELQRVYRLIQSIANTAKDQAEKGNNLGRAILLYDQAATKLDKLPVSHVDEEVQFFAADVAKALREMATELNSAVLEVQALEARIKTRVDVREVPSSFYLPNPWGIRFWYPAIPFVPQYNVQTNQPEIVAAQGEAITKAVRKHNEIWRAMIEKSTALKKALSAKHGVPFN